MSQRIRRLSMLPVCAGLMVGLGTLACSDRRDEQADTRAVQSDAAKAPDGTADTSTITSSQGGTVTASEPAPVTVTTETPRRSTRRSSSSRATVESSAEVKAEVKADDPYAPDVNREPSRTDAAAINAERAEVRTEVRADVNRAEPVDATRNDPALDPNRSSTATPAPTTATPTTPAPAVAATTPPSSTPAANAPTTTPAPSSTPAASSDPNAPLVPVGPSAKGWMNDPQVINVLLLANSGDSARNSAAIQSLDLAAEKSVSTTSLGGTVATTTPAPATRIMRVDSTDTWPPRNMHDDPKPRTRTVEVVVPVEAEARVTAVAPMNAVTPGVSITTAPTGEATISLDDVRAFAETMVRDHTAVNARLAALVTADNVAPAESETSIEVFNANRENLVAPRPVTDNASARAWLEREVRMHQSSLDAIERQLLPLAADDELRAILEDSRRAVAAHLNEARRLLGTAGTEQPAIAPKPALDRDQPMPGVQYQMRSDSVPAPQPMPRDTVRPDFWDWRY